MHQIELDMATLSLYLDTRAAGKNHPLKIVIRNRSTSAMISLGIKLSQEEWDAKKCRVIKHPQKNLLNSRIRQRFNEIENAMNRLFVADSLVKAKEIKLRILNELYGLGNTDMFVDFFREQISAKRTKHTKETYEIVLRKILRSFENAEELRFTDITYDWVLQFKRYLEDSGLSDNSIALALSKVHAVIKEGIRQELIDKDPFLFVKIRRRETRKRAMSIDMIKRIVNFCYKPGYNTRMYEEYKCIFLLILFLRGISMKDLLFLKKSDYKDGYIEYYRYKTHKRYIVKVEPEVDKIIEKIKGKGEYLIKPMDRQLSIYESYCFRFNRALKRMAGDKNVSSYWLRHSWATICINDLNISKEVVSAGLGHDIGNRITAVYIDFDQTKVDEANRRFIDYILYGKK